MSKVKIITPLTAMTVLRLLLALFVFISAVAMALLTMWSGYVYAGVITINFPTDLADPCRSGCFHNTTADGFRISPSSHYDAAVVPGIPGIGWDGDGGPNPDYLGSSVPLPPVPPGLPFGATALYFDHDGLPFGLLSLESLGREFFIAESSKGAIAVIPGTSTPPLHFDFVGEGWLDIQWVTFFNYGFGAPVTGFNQLVASVPGPPTLGLFGLGVLILGWRSRSLKRTQKRPEAAG